MTLTATYEDVPEKANDHYKIETRDGAPVIDSDNMAAVVDAVLTQGELDEGYSLLLVSSSFGEDGAPDADRNVLSAKAKELDATDGVWFDVSLYKVQGENSVKLDEVPTPVNITAKVPESLRKDGRMFYLMSAHGGKAKVAAEGKGDTLAWSTSEFSTYLLGYKDAGSASTAKEKDTTTQKGTADKGTSASSSASSTAKTGDSMQLVTNACAATAALAGAVAIAIALRRRRDE